MAAILAGLDAWSFLAEEMVTFLESTPAGDSVMIAVAVSDGSIPITVVSEFDAARTLLGMFDP